VAQARGAEVNFFMWGGSDKINAWVDQEVGTYLMENYGVSINRVPMDASEFINKLQTEKLAGRNRGSIDLVWINGENFHRAKSEGLLLGSYAQILPNFALVNQEEASFDFGFPTEGYETPYGKAQFVLEYDSAKISNPPRTFAELAEWVKANPGRFTFPEPPDFTGSAFIRQAFYETTGGYAQYLGDFNQGTFDANIGDFVDYMNDIEPYLWMEGKNFPGSKQELDLMFEKGEVDFNMSYTQAGAQGKINDGAYPDTVRTLAFTEGSISNIHFTSIPFNAPNKAAAMVLANALMSPELQLSKNDPENWGDFTILDMTKLDPQDRAKFEALDLGVATLSLEELGANAVPEISALYVEPLEQAWEDQVLKD
jgi:putative spermidine/putrescine transport system substrate-binding protein